MNEPQPGRGPFPIGGGSLLVIAVAGYGLFTLYKDWTFQSSKEKPVAVRTVADISTLEEDKFVEVHMPLDLENIVPLESNTGEAFIVAPIAGTGKKLLYSIHLDSDAEEQPSFEPPYRGRTIAKDFSDEWSLASGLDAKLGDFFDNLPDDALVVRTSSEGITVWRWFISGVAVLALLWILYALVMWILGHNVYAEDEAEKPGESEPEADATSDESPPTESD